MTSRVELVVAALRREAERKFGNPHSEPGSFDTADALADEIEAGRVLLVDRKDLEELQGEMATENYSSDFIDRILKGDKT